LFDLGTKLSLSCAMVVPRRIFQQDAALQRLVPTLDLALGLWVVGCATNMLNVLRVQPLGEAAVSCEEPLSDNRRVQSTTLAGSRPSSPWRRAVHPLAGIQPI
jgi:hypothetical protein